jgi:LasA protease
LLLAGIMILAPHPPATKAGKQIAFDLPWKLGQAWRYVGGPHSTLGCPDNSFSCRGGKPWNSLDFAGGDGIVRAAAAGTVEGTTQCPARNSNFVIINHGGGWHTTYYHLIDIPAAVRPGQPVRTGAKLGHTSTMVGCQGHADGPHVHFSIVRYSGDYSWHGGRVDLNGFQIGTWIFHDGRTQYSGCATNVVNGQRVCPGGLIRSGVEFHLCDPAQPTSFLKASGLTCARARAVVDEWGQRADCAPNGTVCVVQHFTCRVPPQGDRRTLECRNGTQVIVGKLKTY